MECNTAQERTYRTKWWCIWMPRRSGTWKALISRDNFRCHKLRVTISGFRWHTFLGDFTMSNKHGECLSGSVCMLFFSAAYLITVVIDEAMYFSNVYISAASLIDIALSSGVKKNDNIFVWTILQLFFLLMVAFTANVSSENIFASKKSYRGELRQCYLSVSLDKNIRARGFIPQQTNRA